MNLNIIDYLTGELSTSEKTGKGTITLTGNDKDGFTVWLDNKKLHTGYLSLEEAVKLFDKQKK